jgi:hypothetical protein
MLLSFLPDFKNQPISATKLAHPFSVSTRYGTAAIPVATDDEAEHVRQFHLLNGV